MKLVTIVALAVLVLCLPLGAFADIVSISNFDGTITASNADELALSGSILVAISGLPAAYDCPPPGCSGNVSFDTGHVPPTTFSGNLTSGVATFGPGGAFTMTSSTGPGGGSNFHGTFTGATWTQDVASGTWSFHGNLAGTLTVGGVPMMNYTGASIQLTTVGGPTFVGGHNTWVDAGGTTTLTSPVPEQGTLSLLGTGLIGIGVLARRRSSRRNYSRLL